MEATCIVNKDPYVFKILYWHPTSRWSKVILVQNFHEQTKLVKIGHLDPKFGFS